MRKTYTKIGTCIFCGRSAPEVTFVAQPHTMPKAMGGRTIGVDVCDDCNHYFGSIDKTKRPPLSPEICVKEILNVTEYLVDMAKVEKSGTVLPRLRSIYFSIYQKQNLIWFKRSFESTPAFHHAFTHCFKRGLYEMFLQEYHRQTGKGLDAQFDKVRRFARYDEGDLPLWHMQYNMAIGLHFSLDESKGLSLPISDNALKDIDEYGMFSFLIRGFWFYLAVTPKAQKKHEEYLMMQNRALQGSIFHGVVLLEDINQIDFALSRFHREKT